MKTPGLQAVCSATTAAISVVCMSSMGAALAATGAAAGAGATSIAAMGSMSGMGTAPSSSAALALLPSLLERIGLGFFNQLPNAIPAAAARGLGSGEPRHRIPGLPRTWSVLGADPHCSRWRGHVPEHLRVDVGRVVRVSLVGLVAGGLLGLYLTRRPARVAARPTGTA